MDLNVVSDIKTPEESPQEELEEKEKEEEQQEKEEKETQHDISSSQLETIQEEVDISSSQLEIIQEEELDLSTNNIQEKGHIYYIKREKGYTSVTTVVHNAFEKFNANKIIDNMMASPKWNESKYFGMTKDEIKRQWKQNGAEAAKMGTAMHAMFEF